MIFDVIQTLCNQRGISVNQLESLMGVPQSSIKKIKKSVPKADRLRDIAQFFNVPMETFFEDKYDDLDSLKEWHEFVDKEYDSLTELAIKTLLFRTAAGDGAYNDIYSTETVGDSNDNFPSAVVSGNSMYPVLNDGDIVKIKPQVETTPQDLSLVKVNGDSATIKYVEVVENGLWLRAENKSVYEDRFFTINEIINEPVMVVGKVVEIRRKIQ